MSNYFQQLSKSVRRTIQNLSRRCKGEQWKQIRRTRLLPLACEIQWFHQKDYKNDKRVHIQPHFPLLDFKAQR